MKIALIVVFNHRFDKNIAVLRDYYRPLFPLIRFLVPFYDGKDDDVIPVYHNSRFFQGYFATSHHQLQKLDVDSYLIIADDLVVNPIINNDNLYEVINVSPNDNFISNIWPLHSNQKWAHYKDALLFDFHQQGIEVNNIFPEVQVALNLLKKFDAKNTWTDLNGHTVSTKYPLICGYSDFLIINKVDFFNFCRLSGVFAALRLFVEISIPTVLGLITSHSLKTCSSSKSGLFPLAMWDSMECDSFYEEYNGDLNLLINNFPKYKLFVHPIKLSKWRY